MLLLIFAATLFSERFSKFTVAFGGAGAGIDFALQEVIASVAGWIAISLGQFFNPGDRIQLGGIKGDVIDVGVLRTTLMEIGEWVKGDLYNGRIVRISNSMVFKEPVFNSSADFPFLWDEITFPVRYGSDWKYAKEVMEKVLTEVVGDFSDRSKLAWEKVVEKYRVENAEVTPTVTLNADQNWLTYTLRYVVDYRKRRSTKDRIFTRLLEEVDKAPQRIRIATASFELLSVPPVEVQIQRQSLPNSKIIIGR